MERGYVETSLADIASDIGLTKTAVAYHFHPKERLLVELVSPALLDFGREVQSGTPATRAARRAYLRRIVALLVLHRDVVGILATDTGIFTLPSLGGPGPGPRERLVAHLIPPRATPRDVVRAWAALGAAQVAVARTLDQSPVVVRTVATAAALAAYDS